MKAGFANKARRFQVGGYEGLVHISVHFRYCVGMSEPLIDEDIRKAQTLPAEVYQNLPPVEMFVQSPQFAAHSSELEFHNLLPLPRMETLLNQSMLMIGPEPRCFSNVCTHRAMILVDESSTREQIQCPYHGRTFGLDGICKHMPKFEEVEDFPSPSDHLMEYPVISWEGLNFIGSGPGLQTFKQMMSWFPFAKCVHDPGLDRSYEIEANWALYVDNYLEGFHIPFVHPDLNKSIEWDSYSTEVFEGAVLQVAKSRDGEPAFADGTAAWYWWLFPNTMLNIYPWGMSVNIVIPEGGENCRVIYRGYVLDASKMTGAGGELDKVEAEDRSVVESVQRGVRSDSYSRGRFSPQMEVGVHHFHRMYSRWLDGE